ncbi:MAG: divergent polysaccharide deacetylase family protein [Desulfobacterales bacterium]|nr:divergent polysaccharide deacetylase family protein [Desulfobacterales bacterium]
MTAKKKGKPAQKAAPRKKGGRSTKSKSTPPVRLADELKKIFIGVLALITVCMMGAMVADIFLKPKSVERPESARTAQKTPAPRKAPSAEPQSPGSNEVKKPMAGLMEKKQGQIVYEVLEDLDKVKHPKPVVPVKKPDHLPRIAVIIDDVGYDFNVAMGMSRVDRNITFAVLPFSPHGRELSRRLRQRGNEIMLHLPMEPIQYPKFDPGPGALLTEMSPDELLEQLRANLADVGGVAGVNNHMGSEMTRHSNQMNQIFTVLKAENLFFIDSRTSAESTCRASARLLQIPFGERDVFLDNRQEVPYTAGQFHKLLKRARKYGSAIGIGHAYKTTLKTLEQEVPKLQGKIHIVPASSLVHVPG